MKTVTDYYYAISNKTSSSAEALYLPMPRGWKTSKAKIALTTFKKGNCCCDSSQNWRTPTYVIYATRKIKNYSTVAIYLGYKFYIARRLNDFGIG